MNIYPAAADLGLALLKEPVAAIGADVANSIRIRTERDNQPLQGFNSAE